MIKVYLDTSVYNRPFDDQNQAKIFLETEAVFLILQTIETQELQLVSSKVLEYENNRNPFPRKQQAIARYLSMAVVRQGVDESIRSRAKELEKLGVKPVDALHVACAEAAKCDCLITCDRRMINRCQGLALQVLNPVDFIAEEPDES